MELSDEQRTAVRWQWLLMGGNIILVVLVLLFIELLPLDNFQIGTGQTARGLLSILIFNFGGLSFLLIGVLSVRYKVTIMRQRLKFWIPTEGRTAVFPGWVVTIGGLVILYQGLFEALDAGTFEVWCFYFGSLSALVMLGGIVYGLRRVFGRRGTWN